MEKSVLINQNNNLKLKVNGQIDKITILTNENQQLQQTINDMIHISDIIDYMYNSIDKKLSNMKNKLKKVKSK